MAQFTSAAGGAYGNALEQGYNKYAARTYATLVGVSEVTLQNILGGISEFGGLPAKLDGKIAAIDKALLKGAAKLAVSEVGEISEELLQSFLEPALRAIVFGEEYDAPTVQELLDTAITTFISTGAIEGPGIVSATVSEIKNPTGSGVRYDFGVTQEDIDQYVDSAYENKNKLDYKKYAEVSERLKNDVQQEIAIEGYSHALRDNDIRHIRNSHGEKTNEKYPVTKQDIKNIPWIVENYDKVFAKTNAQGKPGLVYVKVGENNVTYYVEAVTKEYHKEKLLVNKQLIKTGINEIPNLHGLMKAINKKESSSQYLADLQEIRKAYAQDVKENYSTAKVTQTNTNVNDQNSRSAQGQVGKIGWDGRVAVTEAKGQNVTVDGVTYKLLGLDKNGSKVYQAVEVLKEQAETIKEKDDSVSATESDQLTHDFEQGERENSKNLYDATVVSPTVKTAKYRKLYNNLEEPVKIQRIAYQCAREMLQHRSGTKFEDMTYINTVTGEQLTRSDYDTENQVMPSKRMREMVRKSEPYTVIALHNHSGSSVPSMADIHSAYVQKYKYGLIVCHDSTLMRYRVTDECNYIVVKALLDKAQKYLYNNNEQAFQRVLAELKDECVILEVFK